MSSRSVTIEPAYACVISCCELAGIIAERLSVLEERLGQLEQRTNRYLIQGMAIDHSESNLMLEQGQER